MTNCWVCSQLQAQPSHLHMPYVHGRLCVVVDEWVRFWRSAEGRAIKYAKKAPTARRRR